MTVCLGNEAGGHNVAIRLTTACSIRPREPTFGRYDARPMTRDLVLLVPGFLGFSRVGNFYYFAERILAGQRDLVTDLQPSKMEERASRPPRRPATTSIRRATRSTRTCTPSRTTGVGHRSRRR